MLSRTADHLFWMARYMERAENTARMLDITLKARLLPQGDAQENRSLRAALSSAAVVSNVKSRPAFNSLMRAALVSNPTVRYFLPNSTAKGSPTYPRPMTAILYLLNPRIALARTSV